MKNDATTELGLAWGNSDPEAAARWVDENVFTENAPAGAASLTSAWVRTDIEAATEWVESLDSDSPARKEAIRALAFHLGEIDPTRGLAWISRLKPEDRNLIIVNFAASWSDSDPQAAANWMRFQSAGIDPRTRDQAASPSSTAGLPTNRKPPTHRTGSTTWQTVNSKRMPRQPSPRAMPRRLPQRRCHGRRASMIHSGSKT